MTDDMITDEIEDAMPISESDVDTIVWTATEMADAIDVDPKAFRSFVRAMVRKRGGAVGVDTPGSGARYAFDVPSDEAERAAFVDAVRDAYAQHRRTNNTRTIGRDLFTS